MQRESASSAIICQRCFSMKHYGSLAPLSVHAGSDVADRYVHAIAHTDALVLAVADIMDFDASLLPEVARGLAGADVILAVNKMDLLPRDASLTRVLKWARGRAAALAFPRLLACACASAREGAGVHALLQAIDEHRHGRHVYVVGAPNTGKSTLINALLAERWGLPRPSAPTRTSTATLFVDELPEGYAIGDVFKGDVSKLVRPAAAVDRQEHDPAERPAMREYSPATAQRTDAYGTRTTEEASSPLSTRDSSLLDSAFEMHESRRASYDQRRRGEFVTVALHDPTADESSGKQERRAGVPPPLPFTTSPLPGTTLGVIGAPLDPHGHSYIYDTPGIVSDVYKQRMLESVARQLSSLQDKLRAKETNDRSAAQRASEALNALVPQRRAPFRTYRLQSARSLFLGGLARIDFVHNEPAKNTGALFTLACHLPCHTTATARAGELFQRHAMQSADATAGDDAKTNHGDVVLQNQHGILLPAWGALRPALTVDLAEFLPERISAGRGTMNGDEDSTDLSSPVMTAGTRSRRLHRTRRALLDIVFHGIGWVAISPIEIEGMVGYENAVKGAHVRVLTCEGLNVSVRAPALLEYEASGLTSSDWKI